MVLDWNWWLATSPAGWCARRNGCDAGDAEVDRMLDVGVQRLHDAVSRRWR